MEPTEADRPLTATLLRIVDFLRHRPEIEASLCFETSDKPFDHTEYHRSNLSEARTRIANVPSFDDFFVRKGDWFIDEPETETVDSEQKKRSEKGDHRDACEYVKHCLNIVKETLDVISNTGQQNEITSSTSTSEANHQVFFLKVIDEIASNQPPLFFIRAPLKRSNYSLKLSRQLKILELQVREETTINRLTHSSHFPPKSFASLTTQSCGEGAYLLSRVGGPFSGFSRPRQARAQVKKRLKRDFRFDISH